MVAAEVVIGGDLLFRGIDLDGGLIIDRNVVVVGGWWAWVVVGGGQWQAGSGWAVVGSWTWGDYFHV